eukprot:5604370-Karenia_brevis.AAC.1
MEQEERMTDTQPLSQTSDSPMPNDAAEELRAESGAAASSESSSSQPNVSNVTISEQPVEPLSGDLPTDSERTSADAAGSSLAQPSEMEVNGEKLDDADVQMMRDAFQEYEQKRSQELGNLDDDAGNDDD